ncbi:unnamed protein product [Penicillium salamii]|uniref:Uncharacterized protein n=1 Tax=Penicillium salamii TaxID=1612424 RepID=A0A9W4NZ53_9EURO|nr:unnamed protein product [Penicillium salamii]CAG7951338.1 unnamed protein product [Penicillium salamii]CAG8005822.1 unnamed protein product [Penicillium salamii]CAG8049166.1 unnamed protein product [Penicillium salamii]CAG8243699.1 unnamed protein product [Penicillium salamii]
MDFITTRRFRTTSPKNVLPSFQLSRPFDKALASDFRAAIKNGDAGQVLRCIMRGAIVNPYDSPPPLYLAVESGFFDIVKILLRYGADVNTQVERSQFGSSLAVAATATATSRDDAMELLLKAGANVNMQLRYGLYGSALAAAAAVSNGDGIELLLKAGADVNMQLTHGCYGSALVAAAATPNGNAVRLLLHAGADVNMQLKYGLYGSALAAAVDVFNCDIVQLLLHTGADVNMQFTHGLYGSALAAAVTVPNDDGIGLLLKAGADVNMQIEHGSYGSALAAAAAESNGDAIRVLLEADADVNMQLIHGHYGSALAAAATVPNSDAVRLLLEAGVDVNMQLTHGHYGSALAAAATVLNGDATRLLLKAGADVNMQTEHGSYGSALAAAAAESNGDVIKLLLEAGADVNMQIEHGSYGSTLAAAAVTKSNGDAIGLLLEAGADVNMQIEHGSYGSALAASVAHEHVLFVRMLIDAGADVNMQLQNGDRGSALAHYAAAGWMGSRELSMLLDAGANVNLDLSHGSFGNALSAAIYTGRDTSDLVRAGAKIGPLSSMLIRTRKQPHRIIEHTFNWELPCILGTDDILPCLFNMGTLTRRRDTVALATCHDFLTGSYDNWGVVLLQGIARALKSSIQWYQDGNLQITTSPSKISLMTTDATPDVRPMLEWICLTFRKPILRTLCISRSKRSKKKSQLESLAPFDHLGDAECWQNLFDSGVIAFQLPDDQIAPCRGLELEFKRLVGLAAVEYPVLVESGLILMGYSTALIPVETTDDGRLMWHLEVAADDFQLQISDLKATKKQWLQNTSFELLQSKTAVLGWCSEAEVLLGTDRLKPTVRLSNSSTKPVSWRWGGANLQLVAQSASPLALGGQLGFTFDRCVNTINFNPSNNYLKCLSNSARQQMVLYDVESKRAWLVSLLSVFHHMLLTWSEQVPEAFRKASPPLALPGSDCGRASLDALRDQGALILDSSGDDATTVRDLVMGFSVNLSKAALQAPKGSNIYGYEFMDIALDSPASELKKRKLQREGLGWISLLNETKCLFCANLGGAIVGKRSSMPLSPCNNLIEGYDLMAASIQIIETLSKRYGDKDDGSSRQLSQNNFWQLAGSPFQKCQHDNQGSCWTRPESLGQMVQEIRDRQSEYANTNCGEFFENGALVFGKQARSRTFFNRVQSAENHTVILQMGTSRA